MMQSNPFVQQIRERILLSSIIATYIKLQKQGKEYLGCCPFHQEKTPSFKVNDGKGVYHCFGCGASGDMIKFLQEKHGYTFMEALEVLANKTGLTIPTTPQEIKKSSLNNDSYTLLAKAADWFHKRLSLVDAAHAKEYLQERGITLASIHHFKIGFAPDHNQLYLEFIKLGHCASLLESCGLVLKSNNKYFDRFKNRIMFPIYDAKDRVIAFGGRALGDVKPKYLNSPASDIFDKSKTLYGLNFLKHDVKEHKTNAKIVEGYLDVISLHQAGIHASVAPLGTALTIDHIKELWKHSKEPVICFDGDLAGKKAANKSATQALSVLQPGYSLLFATLPNNEDPDSMIRTGQLSILLECIRNAETLSDKLWNLLVSSTTNFTPEKLAEVQTDVTQHLQQIPSSVLKKLYVDYFNRKFFSLQKIGFKKKLEKSSAAASSFNASRHRIYILFATIINHPYILHQIEENFLSLEIDAGELQQLRDDIVDYFHNSESCKAPELLENLSTKSYADLLTDVLSPNTYMHASFSRPQTMNEHATKGWNEVYMVHMQCDNLTNELFVSQQNVTKDMTPSHWLRHKALIEQKMKQSIYENE